MDRVEPSWQTRSTSPMSIPSSSEAVATSALSSPALSRCSAASRRSRERLPWCEVTFSSPSDSVSARATRSAMRRVLTNTSVVRWASMRARRRPVDLGPHLSGHHRFERGFRQLQREVALPGVAGVDDGAPARPAVLAAGEEAGDGLDGALGRGQSDAGDGPPGERVQAFEGEREVGAALVAGDGVDLVDDGGADAREHGAPAFAREQDVERLRRRHQDVRRLPAHGLARGARGVAGTHHGADARARLAGFGEHPVDAFERHLQVPVHVVAERLERRDVEHAGGVGERSPAAVAHQGVNGGEKAGERLAGARGRRDERVSARGHRLPSLLLARGGLTQVRGEPGCDGGVESVEGHGVRSTRCTVALDDLRRCCGTVATPERAGRLTARARRAGEG